VLFCHGHYIIDISELSKVPIIIHFISNVNVYLTV